MALRRSPPSSEPQPHEKGFGDQADHQHDPAPPPGGVDDGLALCHRPDDVPSDPLRRGPERPFLEGGGHGGVDEAGLDQQNLDAALMQALAQAGQEDLQRALGGAIGVVGGPATVASDGADGDDLAVALLLEEGGGFV